MGVLRLIRYRTRALLRGAALDRELAEEMRLHLELAAEAHEAQGLSPREARRRALLAFGGVSQQQERVRDARGVRWVHELLADVRYGLRLLRKAPVFTGVAVVSLGLGIGANTAIFSLVNALLLSSLPVPNPQELRVLKWQGTSEHLNFSGSYAQAEGEALATADGVSYEVFDAVRQSVASRAEVFGFFRLPELTVQVGGVAFHASGLLVSPNYFEGLQVGASQGRTFTARDAEAESAEWVVISHWCWQQRFGGAADVLGRTVLLNRRSFVVIGVLPPAMRGLFAGDQVDFYVPMSAQPSLAPGYDRSSRDTWWVAMMARLHPGTTDAAFLAPATLAFGHTAGDLVGRQGGLLADPGGAGLAALRDHYRRPLLVLLAIVSVVILIACANLASLSLARGLAREPEYAVRRALGAGRVRLLRQSLTESLLLGVLGAAAAIPVAAVTRTWLLRLLMARETNLAFTSNPPPLDLRVLAFTVTLALIAAALSGSVSAIRSAAVDPASRLRERSGLRTPRLRAAHALVVAQVALSIVLVTGAGLYGRTLLNLLHIETGFDTDRLLLFRVEPAAAGYNPNTVIRFYDDVADQIAALPGVRGVTLSREALLTGGMSGGPFRLPRRPPPPSPTMAYRHTVQEAYFTTMGIPIVLGRAFRRSDASGAPGVVIINETLARAHLGGSNPLGTRLEMDGSEWTIVGVAADAKYTDVKDDVPATVYFPFRQRPMEYASFAVRTTGDPRALLAAVRAAVARVDPGIPLGEVATQTELRNRRIAQERLFAYLCTALAGLALLLCCIGLYGLLAYHVSRRRGELGVRVALGATRAQIAGPVLRDAVLLAGAGCVLGVPLALALVRIVKAQLYGVEPADPLAITLGVGVLLTVAVLSAWVPARRAARSDPADALRAE